MTELEAGVAPETLSELYPRLYHLTHRDNWDLISRIGLQSTTSLLDLFQIAGESRRAIEASNRRELVPIQSQTYGRAILRDQKPMDDRGLQRALRDGITPEEWYRLVNRHVFFWVDRRRVDTLIGARAYRDQRHLLITARTRAVLERYADQTVLSPLNTGATKPMPHPRGNDCFVPLETYPFEYWRRKRNSRTAVVEFAVQHAVPDLMETVESVRLVGRGEPEQEIWPAAAAV